MNFTKLCYSLVLCTLFTMPLLGKLDAFGMQGISDIIIPKKINNKRIKTFQKNEIIAQRIAEELGKNFTLQDIFKLLNKIQEAITHLLNTCNDDPKAWNLLQYALMDVKKAKMSPYIKSRTVTPKDEHYLRQEIGKINRQLKPIR